MNAPVCIDGMAMTPLQSTISGAITTLAITVGIVLQHRSMMRFCDHINAIDARLAERIVEMDKRSGQSYGYPSLPKEQNT